MADELMPALSHDPTRSSFGAASSRTTTPTTLIAGDRVLSESRQANLPGTEHAPSPTTVDPPISIDPSHKRTTSVLSHQRSVKSITQGYEDRADAASPFLRPPSSLSRPSSPTCSPSPHHHTLDASPTQASALQNVKSYLLPSNSDPTALSATSPRPRSLSSSSGVSLSRSPSIKLASGSYPSTLRPPVRKTSNSSIRSLPEPPRQSAQPADTRLPPASPRGSRDRASPPPTEVIPIMSASQKGATASPVSEPSQNAVASLHADEAESQHGYAEAADDSEEDAALYEGMDSVADLGPSQSSGTFLSTPGVDFSKMTVAERREHSRKHSRVHSRNLSVFFPRPGTEAEAEADAAKARETFEQGANTASLSTTTATGSDAADSTSKVHRRNNSGNRPQITVSTDANALSPRSASFAALTSREQSNHKLDVHDHNHNHNHVADLSPSPVKSRRGHHHRHSVAMLDASLSPIAVKQNGHAMEKSTSSTSWNSDTSYTVPLDASHDHGHGHSHQHGHTHARRSLHARTVSALGHIPQASRPLLLFGISHFGLGAAVWMAGQEVDSLSATGLGYLVVFDAMGILSSAVSDWALEWEQHASDQRTRSGGHHSASMRRPYGTHRVSTLLHFVQTIYLLFAGVYVLKESVEHALLGGGGDDASRAEGIFESASGHEHSHVHAERSFGVVMPNLLLALSLAACVFSNMVMGNHARLVAACGISTAPHHGRRGSILTRISKLAPPLRPLLANPFSLTVLSFSSALLFVGLAMPSIQVAVLDKLLALLESMSMFYIAYPASVALGKVLLQTAPSDAWPNKQQLERALRTVERHPLVSYVPPPNLWQLTPPTSALVQADHGSGMLSGSGVSGRGVHFGSKSASLVASMTVFLRADASDEDCFEMTKWIWERVAPSIAAGRGLMAGEMLRGSQRAGELTVQVKREGHEQDGAEQVFACVHGHDHHDHDHDHGHRHGQQHVHHSHKHSHHKHEHHDHSHGHGHEHSHGHSSHSHNHSADQDQDDNHTHHHRH